MNSNLNSLHCQFFLFKYPTPASFQIGRGPSTSSPCHLFSGVRAAHLAAFSSTHSSFSVPHCPKHLLYSHMFLNAPNTCSILTASVHSHTWLCLLLSSLCLFSPKPTVHNYKSGITQSFRAWLTQPSLLLFPLCPFPEII